MRHCFFLFLFLSITSNDDEDDVDRFGWILPVKSTVPAITIKCLLFLHYTFFCAAIFLYLNMRHVDLPALAVLCLQKIKLADSSSNHGKLLNYSHCCHRLLLAILSPLLIKIAFLPSTHYLNIYIFCRRHLIHLPLSSDRLSLAHL